MSFEKLLVNSNSPLGRNQNMSGARMSIQADCRRGRSRTCVSLLASLLSSSKKRFSLSPSLDGGAALACPAGEVGIRIVAFSFNLLHPLFFTFTGLRLHECF